MKQLMMTAALATMAVSAFGYITADEVESAANLIKMVAATNKPAAQEILSKEILQKALLNKNPSADVEEACSKADSELTSLGLYGFATHHTIANHPFPKLSKAAFDKAGYAEKAPYAYSVFKRHGQAFVILEQTLGSFTIEEIIGLINENMNIASDGYFPPYSPSESMITLLKELQKKAIRNVKKYLRSQGKSFVTKDGKNPCSDLMTSLNNAINAPAFQGLNDWLRMVGITSEVDTSKLLTDEQRNELKESILSGATDMGIKEKFILRFGLGVDGYNAFVKEYNGEN